MKWRSSFRHYYSCSASNISVSCSSVDSSSDDAVKIEFLLYSETKHTFTPDRDTREIWIIPHKRQVVTVRPSEIYNHDSTSIMQSSSGRMIVDFINTHFPSQDRVRIPKIVATIIHVLQKCIPLLPNCLVRVRRIEGIEFVHHLDDEVTKAYVHDRFEATKHGTCAICRDDFEIGRKTSRLPCLHVFHGPCIFKWLQIDRHCPLCRYSLPPVLAPWFNA